MYDFQFAVHTKNWHILYPRFVFFFQAENSSCGEVMKLILSCCLLFGMCDSEQLADNTAVKVEAKTKELACSVVCFDGSKFHQFITDLPRKKTVFDSAPANTQPQTFPWRRRGRQPTPRTHTHTHRGSEGCSWISWWPVSEPAAARISRSSEWVPFLCERSRGLFIVGLDLLIIDSIEKKTQSVLFFNGVHLHQNRKSYLNSCIVILFFVLFVVKTQLNHFRSKSRSSFCSCVNKASSKLQCIAIVPVCILRITQGQWWGWTLQ